MNNIILIGYMGCGKSTVGKQLSQRLKYQFCDTDDRIEQQTGRKISDLFASQGEAYFRELETKLLEQMQKELQNTVVSSGGGMPCRSENAALMKKLGTVIYLKVSKETLIHRLRGDQTRPLLAGEDLDTKIETMLRQRNPLYEAACHEIIDTDELSVEQIVDEILQRTAFTQA